MRLYGFTDVVEVVRSLCCGCAVFVLRLCGLMVIRFYGCCCMQPCGHNAMKNITVTANDHKHDRQT